MFSVVDAATQTRALLSIIKHFSAAAVKPTEDLLDKGHFKLALGTV